jgi:hypothetical protein
MITASGRGPPFRCSGRLSVPLTATLTDSHLYVLPQFALSLPQDSDGSNASRRRYRRIFD